MIHRNDADMYVHTQVPTDCNSGAFEAFDRITTDVVAQVCEFICRCNESHINSSIELKFSNGIFSC